MSKNGLDPNDVTLCGKNKVPTSALVKKQIDNLVAKSMQFGMLGISGVEMLAAPPQAFGTLNSNESSSPSSGQTGKDKWNHIYSVENLRK